MCLQRSWNSNKVHDASFALAESIRKYDKEHYFAFITKSAPVQRESPRAGDGWVAVPLGLSPGPQKPLLPPNKQELMSITTSCEQ